MFISVIVLFVVDLLETKENEDIRKLLKKQNCLFRWICIWIIMTVALVCGMYGPEFDATNFIYGVF